MKSPAKLLVAMGMAFCLFSCKTQRASVKPAADLFGRNLRQYMRLTLSDDSGRSDELIIGLKDKASLNFDIDEDSMYNHANAGIGLCSLSGDGVALTTNVIPLPGVQPEVIRLGVSALENKKLKLRVVEVAGLPRNFEIKLIDRFANVSSDCRESSTYVFNSGKGHNSRADAGRFILVVYQEQYYSFHPEQFYNKTNDRNWMVSIPAPGPGQ